MANCGDGSSYLDCYDAFGGVQGVDTDCFGLHHSCPSSLTTLSVSDFAVPSSSGAPKILKFYSLNDCKKYLSNLKKYTNEPAISAQKYSNIHFNTRSENDRFYELLDLHDNFADFTEDELNELKEAALLKTSSSRREAFLEDWHESLRAIHKFSAYLKETTSQKGVYTNSKCAGCSVMVNGLINSGVDKICGKANDFVYDMICNKIPETFESFCSALLDAGKVNDMIEAICQGTVGRIANSVSNVANDLCSELTCTQPQVSSGSITNESQITGTCSVKDSKVLNERCDEFLDTIALAKKGICIAENALTIVEQVGEGFSNPIKAGLSVLGDLCTGKLPTLVGATMDLIGCSGASVATFGISFIAALIAIVLLL